MTPLIKIFTTAISTITLFEEKQVRRAWNEAEEKWYSAIVDVIPVLTNSPNPQVYWRVMKKRLLAEGNQTVTNCSALKMTSADGNQRPTDVADTGQLLRLVKQYSPTPILSPWNGKSCFIADSGATFDGISTIEKEPSITQAAPDSPPLPSIYSFSNVMSHNRKRCTATQVAMADGPKPAGVASPRTVSRMPC